MILKTLNLEGYNLRGYMTMNYIINIGRESTLNVISIIIIIIWKKNETAKFMYVWIHNI